MIELRQVNSQQPTTSLNAEQLHKVKEAAIALRTLQTHIKPFFLDYIFAPNLAKGLNYSLGIQTERCEAARELVRASLCKGNGAQADQLIQGALKELKETSKTEVSSPSTTTRKAETREETKARISSYPAYQNLIKFMIAHPMELTFYRKTERSISTQIKFINQADQDNPKNFDLFYRLVGSISREEQIADKFIPKFGTSDIIYEMLFRDKLETVTKP